MRDFFDHQDQARASTRRLVFLFVLAVLATVVSVYLVTVLFLGGLEGTGDDGRWAFRLWNPTVLLWAGGATIGLIVIGSLFKTAALRSGGSAVAGLLGGRELDPSTQEAEERRLLNVVEEMAIASGMPVPKIYVLDGEDGINAFAAGFDAGDAAVAVTRGTLDRLSRDELQGVVAHEFSHIAHGDMRLNVRLMGWIFGILLIGLTGRMILRSIHFRGGGKRDNRGVLVILAFGLSLLVIGYIGFFFTRMIKSAVSRQREFLADAAAVQYTRNPKGLVGALSKIAGKGSKLDHPRAEEASHLFFANGLESRWFSWTATHPPLEERIRRLDPDGIHREDLPDVTETAGTSPPPVPAQAGGAVMGLAGGEDAAQAPTPAASGESSEALRDPGTWIARAGEPNPQSLALTAEVLQHLPLDLYSAAHHTSKAQALIYALLLDQDPAIRSRQLRRLDEGVSGDIRQVVDELIPKVDETPSRVWVPLVDLSLPALRHMTPDRHDRFRTVARELAEADGQTDLFELVLGRILLRHLDRHFHPDPSSDRPRYRSLRRVDGACSVLLSALAHYGHDSTDLARQAFEAGLRELELSGAHIEFRPEWEADLPAVGNALDDLSGVAPKLRRMLLRAAVRAVLFDGEVTLEETELLRAVADGLGAPMPPLLAGMELDA